MMSAFKKASEYKTSISDRIQELEKERDRLEEKVSDLTQKTTTAAALISGSPDEMKELRQTQQDLTIINERLAGIEKIGGLNGVLMGDPRMAELSDAVYVENLELLESLIKDKEQLKERLNDVFNLIEQLEQDVSAHTNKVEKAEKEIEIFKHYSSIDFPKKLRFRHHDSHFERQYYAFFHNFKHIQDLWDRSYMKNGG